MRDTSSTVKCWNSILSRQCEFVAFVNCGEDTGEPKPSLVAPGEAELSIYDGVVIASLPNDQPAGDETTTVYWNDLSQQMSDCYLIAAFMAAARQDPGQLLSMIATTANGYTVTFPNQQPITLTGDLDRGLDMVDMARGDVDSSGRVEIWPVLMEAAYAVMRSPGSNNPFNGIGGGDSAVAYENITGRDTQEVSLEGQGAPQLADLASQLAGHQILMSTGEWDTQFGATRPGWWREDHVYVITSITPIEISGINPYGGGTFTQAIGPWIYDDHIKRFVISD